MVQSTWELQQVSALMALRNSFAWHGTKNLNHWWPDPLSSATENWLLSDLCSSVPGISCSRSKKDVMFLDWKSLDLLGTIPTEIGYLTKLERLGLGNNALQGIVPTSLELLSSLEHLELFRNDFTGPLPDIWFNMTNLKRLVVQSNHLTGPLTESLCSLTSLQVLDIFNNLLTGTVPECLGSLALASFQLHETHLTGTIPIDLCESNRINDMVVQSSGSLGVGCDAVACPVFTYEPINGRQSPGSSCQLCPTALYLGSTSCPNASDTQQPSTQSPTMEISTAYPTFAPTSHSSSSPAPSTRRTVFPTAPPSTAAPSILSPSPTLWQSGSNTGSPTQYASMSEEKVASYNSTDVPSSPLPTGDVLLNTLAPHNVFDASTPTNGDSRPSSVKGSDNGSSSTNWTLLATACLLSALAMLTVVLARCNGRQWWHVKQQQEQQQQQQQQHGNNPPEQREDAGHVQEDPRNEEDAPSSSIAVAPSNNKSIGFPPRRRSLLLSSRENSFRSVMSTSTSSTRSGPRFGSFCFLPGVESSLSKWTKLEDYPRTHDENNKDNDDEDSLESDTGWNDTVSSVDDSSTSSSSSASGHVPNDRKVPRPGTPAGFANELVPV